VAILNNANNLKAGMVHYISG